MSKYVKPPPEVRGMTELQRLAFSVSTDLPAIRVPNSQLERVMFYVRPLLFKMRDFKPVRSEENSCVATILLDPLEISNNKSSVEKVIQQLEDKIPRSADGASSSVVSAGIETVQISYENFSWMDVFDAVLPENSEKISGFSQIGHIIHMNLKENLLPFRHLVGQVLVDKIPTCKTVVNKIETIENEYRNFNMELLAGDPNMETEVAEYGLRFQMDFSKVFWNSRLSTEHRRIATQLKQGDWLFDVCAGVGPFAIPAAKKGCQVVANDLNPDCVHWLRKNIELNKIKPQSIDVYNMDAVQFIREVIPRNLPKVPSDCTCHVTMNLPAMAVEFLPHFRGLLTDNKGITLRIHCYCFSKNETGAQVWDSKKDAVEKCEKSFGLTLPLPGFQNVCPHVVRNVAPAKEMVCVTFDLGPEILCQDFHDDDHLKPAKRLKTS